ncbi:UNVERIFIED_CONTAM: response regulator RpfG family c-di-GMP phosphodiesterase [Acetivibrio alkalicellulosi]
MQNTNSEYMDFFEEEETLLENNESRKLKVLIVDDDEEVHTVTKLALSDFVYKNSKLLFLSAYSEKEAKEVIYENPDIAVILLDVVMEQEDSGLKLVQYIRNDIKNDEIRIILRTGQPGQAPERKVIFDFDINDYKEKTELTAQKLFTTMVSSLRAYDSIHLANQNKKGLEKIVEATNNLFEVQSINKLSSIVLDQITSILCINSSSMYKKPSGFIAFKENGDFFITSGNGSYAKHINKRVKDVTFLNSYQKIEDTLREKRTISIDDNLIIHFKSNSNMEYILYIENIIEYNDIDNTLIEIFSSNISSAFENTSLNLKLRDTQKEIIFTLGEIAEARSKETGNHVKRVAEFSKLIALKYGLSEEESEVISLASAMHDIGKMGIPSSILNKPGKLTKEEFEVMKTHTEIGYQMLEGSNKDIIKTASIIALQHHEKYNGTGYPNGLKGNDIHIYGRITAIADVFDALGTVRVYKPAWELDKIIEYFKEERGKHFDPNLLDIFFKYINEVLAIRDSFPDK